MDYTVNLEEGERSYIFLKNHLYVQNMYQDMKDIFVMVLIMNTYYNIQTENKYVTEN